MDSMAASRRLIRAGGQWVGRVLYLARFQLNNLLVSDLGIAAGNQGGGATRRAMSPQFKLLARVAKDRHAAGHSAPWAQADRLLDVDKLWCRG
jgi:hypothetical protein